MYALDGSVADYRGEMRLRRSTRNTRSLGLHGKWYIHPARISAVSEVFTPTGTERLWVQKVVNAYEEAGGWGELAKLLQ